ncbi:hypothetical protein IW261DRAFT_1553545 [Armillaria novae-zelandiae]|uniref:ribonuclease H n=1 Tax=Armillaria novae-zelandiae TaxID=153914 RepID=A0AA39NTG9_9AGAR|nr:hypothetical protein IW261DRAFT_1553545 [Armillaria novae-zelandiae]
MYQNMTLRNRKKQSLCILMDEATAGAGVFYQEGDVRNRSICLPNEIGRTNQASEIVGAKTAAEDNPKSVALDLVSDSKHVLDGLSDRFIKWEDEGYLLIANSAIMQTMIARFRARGAPTRLIWVKGHSGNPGNEGADKLAGLASRRQNVDLVDTTIPPELRTRGAKLSALTQATSYEIIRQLKQQTNEYQDKLDRKGTNRNLSLALAAAVEEFWRSIRRKEFNRSARYFLWMVAHDGYTVGYHWKHIKGCEERAVCKECSTEESMDHILTTCEAPGQDEVWNLAKGIWKQKTGLDLVITKGIIMACGVQPPEAHRSPKRRASERFRRILISESAHLIWKMRNDRVINEKQPYSEREIEQRWLSAMNRRLRTDCLLTNKKKFHKKAILTSIVLKTWQGTLVDENILPENWIKETGVLVGMVK